ncbi:glycosyl transferase family protein [Calothrix sp. NIES-4071]|nr:glycosyl transferase family protein [Calothrix sp. NIES-4071]BAZ55876.1 glycosyl transferase family protein [Calothrix sp. NIES-4105]
MPKVTVLMAVYNGERYLKEAIESILNQTFQDFEFLIINDGSCDSTREIIKSYQDSRIRLVENSSNLGLTRSLNKGLKLAEGEFIVRQDADDISEPERLSKQVAFLETHFNVALVGTWYKEIDAWGNLIGNRKLPCDCTKIRWDILFYCPFVHSAMMLRKSIVIKQIGLYDEAFVYAQDYDLWSRIARSLPVANLNEYLIKLRINPESMTATYGSIIDDETRQIMTANIGYLLDWEQNKVESTKLLFRTMAPLMIDSIDSMNIQMVTKSIDKILDLQTAFCQYYKLNSTESVNQRTKVCIRMSYQLIKLAHCSLNQDNYNSVWQLLVQAYRLHLPILLTKTHARIILKLLIGQRLIKRISYLTQS